MSLRAILEHEPFPHDDQSLSLIRMLYDGDAVAEDGYAVALFQGALV
jgi:hypothetical protein